MRDLEKYLKVLSEGMKTLAKGFESVADRVDKLAKAQGLEQPAPKTAPKPAAKQTTRRPAKKTAPKKPAKTAKPAARKAGAQTATEQIYQLISRHKNGIDTAAIKKNTGFNDKKVQNIIYKLKKQGKIKSTAKGVYEKAS